MDTKVYNKINANDNFTAVFVVNGVKKSMQDIINLC